MLAVMSGEMSTLLAIFPQELWELIFDQTEDIDDQTNFIKSSQGFRELLKSKRTTYLFLQVLRVLDNENYLTYRDVHDVLNCRLVCSKWKRTVNTFLEIRPFHFNLNYKHKTSRSIHKYKDVAWPTYFYLCMFSVEKLRNEILPEISKPLYQNYNPFPSRHIDIIQGQSNVRLNHPMDLYTEEIERYRILAEEFLGKVGPHFWHARIHTRRGDNGLYEQIGKYVRLMPNLKTLHLPNPLWFGEYDDRIATLISENEDYFPTLTNLEMISFRDIPLAVVNEILARNSNVKIIEINGYQRGQVLIGRNVEQISTPQAGLGMSEHLPKLQTLYLQEPLNCKMPGFFNQLENFKDTLLELYLQFFIQEFQGQGWREERVYSREPWDLPKLEKLSIWLSSGFSLDFLLGLKSLQDLHLRVNFAERKFVDDNQTVGWVEKINFYSGNYSTRFMECNIWELIPSLKIVCLKVDAFPAKIYRRGQTGI